MAARARTVSDTLSAELGIDAGGDAGVGVAAVVVASSMKAGGGGRCSLELWQLELW